MIVKSGLARNGVRSDGHGATYAIFSLDVRLSSVSFSITSL